MRPYKNSCGNVKFLPIISVYWPRLHERFPPCGDTAGVCVCDSVCDYFITFHVVCLIMCKLGVCVVYMSL